LGAEDAIQLLFFLLGRADLVVGCTERQVLGIKGLPGSGFLLFLQEVGHVVQGAPGAVPVFPAAGVAEFAEAGLEFPELGAVVGDRLAVALSDLFGEAMGLEMLFDRGELGLRLPRVVVEFGSALEQALLLVLVRLAPLGLSFGAEGGGAGLVEEVPCSVSVRSSRAWRRATQAGVWSYVAFALLVIVPVMGAVGVAMMITAVMVAMVVIAVLAIVVMLNNWVRLLLFVFFLTNPDKRGRLR
jgi:hypothetical protein